LSCAPAGWGASVIRAMGDGRKAAEAIHRHLAGDEGKDSGAEDPSEP